MLAGGEKRRTEHRPIRLRRVLLTALVVAVVIAGVIAIAGSLVSRQIAQRQAVHDVAEMTDLLAESVVRPVLTDRMARSPQRAAAVLDPVVRRRVLSPSLVRVKLWRTDGTVLYSDEPLLVGRKFGLDEEARSALHPPRTEAGVTDLSAPENRYERSQGTLLDVYRPVWTPNGHPLLFETYWRYDTVSARSSELWRGFSGVMLTSLAALFLLLIPVVWVVFAWLRLVRTQREELAAHAAQASDEQRRHITASLPTASSSNSSEPRSRARRWQNAPAAKVTRRWARRSTRSPRTCATASPGCAGSLSTSIRQACTRLGWPRRCGTWLVRTARVVLPAVNVRSDVASRLTRAQQEAAFAVAQEALRNVARHARATKVEVSLQPCDPDVARLECATTALGSRGKGFKAGQWRVISGCGSWPTPPLASAPA